ncbi:MAG: RNA-binding protein [Robiginitomaculum sp.]|nr:MAG: RNA-binding protein [Robiginitomaculum sp.]
MSGCTRARFFKTRTLGAKCMTKGRIRIERDGQILRVRKPHTEIRIGDKMTFTLGDRLVHIEILAAGKRRGPASEAHKLYSECVSAT